MEKFILRHSYKKCCPFEQEQLLIIFFMEVERALVALPDFKSGAPG